MSFQSFLISSSALKIIKSWTKILIYRSCKLCNFYDLARYYKKLVKTHFVKIEKVPALMEKPSFKTESGKIGPFTKMS